MSLFEALAEWMGFPLYYEMYGTRRLERTGARHASIAPYGPFAVSDGEILLGIQNDGEFIRLCTLILGLPELPSDERFATNEARCRHVGELTALIEAAFAELTAEEVGRRPAPAGRGGRGPR